MKSMVVHQRNALGFSACVCVCVRRWITGHKQPVHPATLTFPWKTVSVKDGKDGKHGAERRCAGGGREEGQA